MGVGMISIRGRNGVGNDSHTKVLCHFDGTNGQTTTINSGGSSHTVTLSGSSLSSSKVKFGTTSYFNSAAGSEAAITDTLSDFSHGLIDFTIDLWVYQVSNSAYPGIIGSPSSATTSWTTFPYLITHSGLGGKLGLYDHSTGNYAWLSSGAITGAWHHVAICRFGSSLFGFFDGIKQFTLDVTGKSIGNAVTFYFGREFSDASFVGYIDEARISNGIARWIHSFTPPNRAS